MKKLDKDEKVDDKKKLSKAKNEIDFEPETKDDVAESEMYVMYVMEGDLSDIDEHADLLTAMHEALSVTQRLKKRQVMRRFKGKMKTARKRSRKRKANLKVIKKRARRQAITNVKKILSKGRNLKKASASEKNRIERMAKRRGAFVNRLSKRLVIQKRRDETKRFQKNSESFSGDNLMETFNTLYDNLNKEK